MIWRGAATLGDASVGATALMFFVAAVTGLLLPTLIYIGTALDGSTYSRERDALATDLSDELHAYLETIDDSRRDLAGVAEIGDTLKRKTFLDICNATQEAVDPVYDLYGAVRLLIGALSAEPPSRPTKTIGRDGTGNNCGKSGTASQAPAELDRELRPGGQPLRDAQRLLEHPRPARRRARPSAPPANRSGSSSTHSSRRLAEIETQRMDLLARIDALPPIPPIPPILLGTSRAVPPVQPV